MVLDNEEQRSILLQLIAGSNFKGDILEKAFLLKQAIQLAQVDEQKTD